MYPYPLLGIMVKYYFVYNKTIKIFEGTYFEFKNLNKLKEVSQL